MDAALKRMTIASCLVLLVLLLGSCAKDPEKAKAKYLASGQSYMKKGRYGDAAVEFRNALRLDPRFVDAYYQLAQADLAQHEWRAAYGSLEKAIELDPSRLDARLDRGRLYLAARDFTDAEVEASTILKREPNNVAAHQLRGAALIGQQKPDEALVEFSKLTELRPNDASAYVNLALVEISLRHFAEAERYLKEAVVVDPKSLQAWTDLANFYRLQARQPEAEQVLQEAIAKNPDGASLYLDWASAVASQGRKEDAEAVLARLRKQIPNSADVAQAIGDFYFQMKETDRALVEYRRGLLLTPKNLELKKRMQDLYLTTRQTQLAADLDQEVLKDSPKDTIVLVNHGRLLMAQGNPQSAVVFLQKVVADAADSAQAHYYLAMAHWQNGDTGQARTALMEALKVSPDMQLALESLVRLSLDQGNAVEARTYAGELRQQFPFDPEYRLLVAEVLTRQGQLGPAEQEILIAKQLAPNDSNVRLSLAQVYSAEKKWSEAQKVFETSVQLDPHNTTALAQFAEFLVARGQDARALALVRQYIATNPNDANGHQILGALYFGAKNYSDAQTELERSIQLDPNNMQAYLRLGKLFEATGRTDTAIAQYQKALDLHPKQALLATLVGNLYLKKGELGAARRYYDQALGADPNFPVANANMAWVDAQEGKNLDVALGMAQKAKSLMPEVPSITDTLGWVMYKRGNYDGAIPLLRECVQKSPDSANFRFHLGMTLLAAGQKARGREQLEAALRMNLDAPDAHEARQALELAN